MRFLSLFCILIISSKGTKLPPNFKKCNRNQPDAQKCLKEAAQYGISQLGRPYKKLNLPTVEPLEILEMSAHVSRGAVHLTEHLTNCKFFGLSKTVIERFDFDLKRRFVDLDTVFPKLDTSCDYDLNGTLLGARIYGRGASQIHFTNFHIHLHMTYDELRRRNKTYAKITTSTVEGKPEGLRIKVENLFDGDQIASERMNQLINDNWSELYDDVKADYLDIPNQLFKQLGGRFFSKFSVEDLFD